jgi:SAM-dependent methyltransferase
MTPAQRSDHSAFHQFEQLGWERAAEHYVDAFGTLTIQAADPMLDAVGVSSGTRLLDVACGPGVVAGAAAARGAAVIGVDFAAAMIATARHRHPGISFEEGDAEALRFDHAAFDAVVMNFGMLHLARPDAAIAEAYRVLRPGGRYAFTVWASPEHAVGFGLVHRAIEALGNKDVPLPEGPPFFRFSAEEEARRTLERAGFSDVDVRQLPMTWRLSSPDDVYDALSRGGVRTAAVLRAQAPAALDAIRAAVRQGVEAHKKDGVFLVPMPAMLASGRKP